jgi:hypothetical protein
MALSGEGTLSPNRIWDWIRSSLEMDMTKATFDERIRPVRYVSFEEGSFTLAAPDAFTCQWLENRMKTTIERMIGGLTGGIVQARFILADPVLSNDGNCETEEIEPVEEDQDAEAVYLEPIYASLRDALIEPGRVVKLPVYLLRWLPYVGARTIFEVLGFWQEYYLNSKGRQPCGYEKVATRIERVCQWAGVSRAQLFRDLQPGGALDWFLRKIETDHEFDKRSGRTKKSANKYALYGIPITPGDAIDLADFLTLHGVRQNPIEAVKNAVQIQPNQILQYPFQLPPPGFQSMPPRRIVVQEVVRDAVGYRLDGELSNLADQLADRLLAPGDFILVSWYFLQNWLPRLGHNAAIFITLLRELCYFNDETGEIRDDVWLEDGYPSIASRLGIDNSRLVAQWFPAVFDRGGRKGGRTPASNVEITRQEDLQKRVASFVERIDYCQNSSGLYNWHFKVQRYDPLIPEHERIRQAAVSLLIATEDEDVLGELYQLLEQLPNACFETLKTDPMLVLRLSKTDNACSETLEKLLNACFETLKDLPNACFETLLKILKSFKDSQKQKDSASNQDSSRGGDNLSDSAGGGGISFENWSLEKLLVRVNLKTRQMLLDQEKSPIPFVSWVLYGVSDQKIQNPVSLAISRLKAQPGQTAGGVYERLAGLSPESFTLLLQMGLTWQGVSDKDWQLAFKGVSQERLRMLADNLALQINPEIRE